METTAIVMPKLGMSMEEGTVIEWPRSLGEHVEKGQTVLVIESEKNEAEIEATGAGVLRHIYVEPGETVPCKTLLAVLTEDAEAPFDAESYARQYEEREGPAPKAAAPVAAPSLAPRPGSTDAAPSGGRKAVAPAARALAKKLGLDVLQVAGSGPGGRVVRQDVEAYAAARERLTEVEAGVSLELLREGEGAPVLFLPGFGTDVSSFATQTQALAERYRVLALNPRGVGHSDAPELPSYPVERAADDAAAVLDEPAHLVGASLGAATAIELALRHPDKVRSLALITPFTTRSARLHAVSEAWAAVAAEAAPETLARFLLPWLFSEDFLTHDTARTRTLRGLTQTVARVPAPTLQRSRAGLESWSGTRTKDLADLCVPTLVLIAGGDLLTPEGEALATAIPDAHTVLIAGAGHALAVEAAESVTRSLREHLEG